MKDILNAWIALAEIIESVAIGQEWEGDIRIILFVTLRPTAKLNQTLIETIKARLRQYCSPRHVPARVLSVNDIPRTKSGKVSVLAVRDTVHGKNVENIEALANPESLMHFKNRLELQS